ASVCKGQLQTKWHTQTSILQTRWAKFVDPKSTLPEYPRPQLQRRQWTNLNGLWDYTITDTTKNNVPSKTDGQLLVPFPIESALSGVQRSLTPGQFLWYKRAFPDPRIKTGERLILHFGAVDFQAVVFLNGKKIGIHRGGYQNFDLDIT